MAAANDNDALGARLAALVGDAWGTSDVVVEELQLLSGGASRETWSFDAVAGSPPRRQGLILQRRRGGSGEFTGPSAPVEDALLAAAERRGVPVPPTIVPSDRLDDLGEGRISARLEGEALGRRIVHGERYAAAREQLVRQCGAALAGIHAIAPDEVPGLEAVDPLARLRGGLDLLDERRPAFELAMRWLDAHRPTPNDTRIVHGDFRIGNLLVDEQGLRAVLDWELTHLGDPLEDLGWFCVRAWRFGGAGVAGGIGSVDELVDAYVAAGGVAVDVDAVRWWTVLGTLTWGLICAVQARRHLDGAVRSVELAAIGRRVCETEYDVLDLLADGGDDAGTSAARAEAPAAAAVSPVGAGFHGRPTAAELIESVREHLVDHVAPGLTGSGAFHLKVATNVLAIVERELQQASTIEAAHAERLALLGVADDDELSRGIRSGELAVDDAVVAAVRADVVDRLRVANPRWLHGDDAIT